MNRDLPLVSIVTPSYNQGRFIEDTILSVKNQNYPNVEHIIMDGGSTDNTLEILRKYEKEYNLIWGSEPDEGQSDAVNKGFEMAKGQIIGWLNSDDVYFDKKVFSHVVEEFEKNPSVDVIYGDCVVIDKSNFIKRVFKGLDWNYNLLLIGSSYIPCPATFLRKDVIVKNKLDRNLNYAMDIEFWLRLGKNYKFLHTKRILAGDRLHEGSKRISGDIKTYKHESKKIREHNGQRFDFKYYLVHYCAVLYVVFFTRILGIKNILKMKSINNLAFNAKYKNKLTCIVYQLFPFSELKCVLSNIFKTIKKGVSVS